MVSKTRVRRILKNPNLTDEQIERLMDEMYKLVRIFLDDQKSKGGSKRPIGVIDTAGQKSDDKK